MSSERYSGVNYLNRLGHQLRTVKHEFLANDPTTRTQTTRESLARIISPNLTDDLLEKQLGGKRWLAEDYDDIPEQARAILEKSFIHRSEPLWVVHLFDKNSSVRTALTDKGVSRNFETGREVFIEKYGELATGVGLFPTAQKLENVPNQRLVPRSVRNLAAQILFFDKLIETQSLEETGTNFVNTIADAQVSYIQKAQELISQSPHEPLQEALLKKESAKAVEVTSALSRFGYWESPEDLAMACVDRGLRDLITDYYGIFRDINTERGSGYHEGQHIMALGTVIRSCLRAA